mmetsp:Transcript_41277/g.74409  ORF Transcript_41277/g.74409 Transcript_41277/m.74409 type:complete len:200 (-) Transcript_41277:318-917(-)
MNIRTLHIIVIFIEYNFLRVYYGFVCLIIESISPINLFANALDRSSSLSIPNARSQHVLASFNTFSTDVVDCCSSSLLIRFVFPTSFPSANSNNARFTHADPRLGRYLTASANASLAFILVAVFCSWLMLLVLVPFPCMAYMAPMLAWTSAYNDGSTSFDSATFKNCSYSRRAPALSPERWRTTAFWNILFKGTSSMLN